MPAQLTLVCHAATRATRRAAFPLDEPAEPAGLGRAAALRDALGRATHALTSPALRARQTAEALGLAAEATAALRDADFGRWAGRTLAEVEQDEPEAIALWLGDPAAAPHGGESFLSVIDRTRQWLDGLEGRVVAVTHPAIIRAAVVSALAAPAAALWRADVEPLSLIRLTGSAGRWTLRL